MDRGRAGSDESGFSLSLLLFNALLALLTLAVGYASVAGLTLVRSSFVLILVRNGSWLGSASSGNWSGRTKVEVDGWAIVFAACGVPNLSIRIWSSLSPIL